MSNMDVAIVIHTIVRAPQCGLIKGTTSVVGRWAQPLSLQANASIDVHCVLSWPIVMTHKLNCEKNNNISEIFKLEVLVLWI